MIACTTKKKLIIAGPGQKPVKPHPSPKRAAPIIKFLSIGLFLGGTQKVPYLGEDKSKIKQKVTMLIETALAITNNRDGSHLAESRVKNPKTFDILSIPEIVIPSPKINPTIKDMRYSLIKS